jgi:hypothetical protein
MIPNMENVAPARRANASQTTERNGKAVPGRGLSARGTHAKGLSARAATAKAPSTSKAPPKRRALGDITNKAQLGDPSQQQPVIGPRKVKHAAAREKVAPLPGRVASISGRAAVPKEVDTAKNIQALAADAELEALVPRDEFGNVEDIEPIPEYEVPKAYHSPVLDLDLDDEALAEARSPEQFGAVELEPLDFMRALEPEPESFSSYLRDQLNTKGRTWSSSSGGSRPDDEMDGSNGLEVEWPALALIPSDDTGDGIM